MSSPSGSIRHTHNRYDQYENIQECQAWHAIYNMHTFVRIEKLVEFRGRGRRPSMSGHRNGGEGFVVKRIDSDFRAMVDFEVPSRITYTDKRGKQWRKRKNKENQKGQKKKPPINKARIGAIMPRYY